MIIFFRRKTEMLKFIETKMAEAKQRKDSHLTAKRESKMRAEIAYFKKHSMFRQQTLLENIKRFEIYQQEQRDKIEVGLYLPIFFPRLLTMCIKRSARSVFVKFKSVMQIKW